MGISVLETNDLLHSNRSTRTMTYFTATADCVKEKSGSMKTRQSRIVNYGSSRRHNLDGDTVSASSPSQAEYALSNLTTQSEAF